MYQADKPMLLFLYLDLKLLSMKLIELIVKPEVLEKHKSGVDFKNIGPYSLDNIKGNNICIGYAAATTSDLKKKDSVKKTELKQFKSGCKTFLITLLEKLFGKSPLGSALVRNSAVFVIATTSQKKKQTKI